MLHAGVIVLVSLAYLGVLFAIAYAGDRRAERGRSVIDHATVYALSLAVYATAWTFYGSVGRAAASGPGFLPIYLGPTLVMALGWVLLRKMIRISKAQRITSIADFVAARYGKSALLGGLVTLIAVVGIVPYIALQLKAVSTSFGILVAPPQAALAQTAAVPASAHGTTILGDSAFYIAALLAAFTVVFGTRHLDATERHEGMVAAIAFESLVKLLAFVAVGAFVTWGMHDGLAALFAQAAAEPATQRLFTMDTASGGYGSWASLTFLSGLAFLFLPRQFQVGVVENVNENHVGKAIWLLPLYMLVINLFVLPITVAGLLQFPAGQVDPDTFVLTLPLAHGQQALALLVFVGGLSAATGMVIVETIALSTMVCNDLVMPVLLRWRALALARRTDLTGLLLAIRRGAIVLVMMLGYAYYHVAGEAYALVAIGLVSFAAVAQFAPAMLGGMYWRRGTRLGALAGLGAGFGVWAYTLLLPSFARSGWLPISFIEAGLWGVAWLKPLALFGLAGLDNTTHALFWSLLANAGAYVGVSLAANPLAAERSQAALFVDAFSHERSEGAAWRGSTTVKDVEALLARFLGPGRAGAVLADYAARRSLASVQEIRPDNELVGFSERLLAGAIGASSARVMVASVVKEEPLGMDEVLHILDEASQVIAYSHELEQKSRALEVASAELRAANERLQELDRLKDDFISTVTHELRTPLTSIRAMAEILQARPHLDVERRTHFVSVIVKESERLTRLINQVLDLAKLESGAADWHSGDVDLRALVQEAVESTAQLFGECGARVAIELPEQVPLVRSDRDRLTQVLLNLLANAAKFSPAGRGEVAVRLAVEADALRVDVADNGPGIAPQHQQAIFEKFRQVGDTLTAKPQGTGLGLPISRQIVQRLGGRLWVHSAPGAGATFSFTVPFNVTPAGAAATGAAAQRPGQEPSRAAAG
ncbi:MAG: histidine kinase [Rubrivivax sp.]|nr:histidine kinase [Rubrivivax sp.]